MKILFLAHRIPFPPNKGDKIRSFHELAHLSRNHEVHLMAFCDQAEDLQYAEALKPYCRSVTLVPLNPWKQRFRAGLSLVSGEPFSLGYFATRTMKEAVDRKLAEERFNAIFVYSSSVAPYVESVPGVPKILDFVDSDASKWAQYASVKKAPASWLYRVEAGRLKDFEVRMLDRFDCCAFVSSREVDHLPLESQGKALFIQNGIDQGFYKPSPRDAGSHRIVFTGAMDYYPNVDAVSFFAMDVFPEVRRSFPDAEFVIVGSRPAPAVLNLAKLPGVIVTGTVKDVRPYLASARLSVAPLRISQGIQNKILEALATGLPVVASPNASAGLKPMKNMPLAVAGEAGEFAERVKEFLRMPPLSPAAADRCRQQLQEHYDWTTNLNALDRALERLCGPEAPARRSDYEEPVTAPVS